MAIGKGVVLALVGVAAAGVAFLSGQKSAKAAPTQQQGSQPLVAPTAAQSTPAIAARMVAVLATADAAKVRAEAAKLRQEGFEAQARDLENAAAVLEQAASVVQVAAPPPQGQQPPAVVSPPIAVPPPIPPPAAIPATLGNVTATSPGQPTGSISNPPPVPSSAPPPLSLPGLTLPGGIQVPGITITGAGTPTTPLPGIIPPTAPAPPPDAKRLVAAQTVQAVKGKKKGQENQSQVRLYQTQEQAELDKIDGKWGFSTAKSVIKYGLVPPPPLYWQGPVNRPWDVAIPKQEWRALMLSNAARDPQRAEEWTRAAQV